MYIFTTPPISHPQNPQKIVRGLQRKCGKYLGPSVVSTEQLTRLVARLIEQLHKDAAARLAAKDDSTKENVSVGNQESGTKAVAAESVADSAAVEEKEDEEQEEEE